MESIYDICNCFRILRKENKVNCHKKFLEISYSFGLLFLVMFVQTFEVCMQDKVKFPLRKNTLTIRGVESEIVSMKSIIPFDIHRNIYTTFGEIC